MKLQPFFDDVPRLRVQDPLARILGCAEDGVIEYTFGDAVRLTGHACPTVAAAYWLTWLALEHLFPGELPQRGGIKVEFRDDARSGNTGVMATVVQMLTGAAGSSGFKGLRGRFVRVGLIRYKPDLLPSMRFTRLDTRAAVDVSADLASVPVDERVEALMARCLADKASPAEEAQLGELWQARVKAMLLEHGRDAAVFTVRGVEPWRRRGRVDQLAEV